MKKHSITIEKSARYFTIGEVSEKIKTVLFVCHGYAQLADEFLAQFSILQNESILIVAPEGLHRFYTRGHEQVVASWMTKVDREEDIQDYISYLDKVYLEVLQTIFSNPKIIVLGFSQGAATVSRWATMGKSNIDELILWCGFFPPDLNPSEIPKNILVTEVTASNDKFISKEQEESHLKKMKLLCPQMKHVRFEGEHEMNMVELKKVV